MVPERYRWLYGLNPMAGVIDGFRWALTGTGQAPTTTLLASSLIVCFVLFGGLVFFNYMEGSIADRV
jgi:lipopolysaccharide transport system permease protein